jgi:hypothetical protein
MCAILGLHLSLSMQWKFQISCLDKFQAQDFNLKIDIDTAQTT